MFTAIGKLLLGRVLSSSQVKERVFQELRERAKDTSTSIDDDAVKIVEEIWDVVVPIVSSRF